MEENKNEVMEERNEEVKEMVVAPQKSDEEILGRLTHTEQSTFTSIKGETVDEKKQLFKAMNEPDFRISDLINGEINMKDLYVQIVEVVDKETGELRKLPRTVIFDEKGQSYVASSYGIYNSITKIVQLFGLPTWENPIPVKIKQVTKDKHKMLTLDLI